MIRSKVLGIGSFVPDRVVTNDELRFLNERHEVCKEEQMATSDEWIRTRTGIQERRYVPTDESNGQQRHGYECGTSGHRGRGR